MVLEFWDRRFSSFCGTNGPHVFWTNGSQFFGQTVLTFWDNTVGATEKYILCHAHGIGHALSGDKPCQKRYIVSPAEEPQRVSKKDCLIRKRTKKKGATAMSWHADVAFTLFAATRRTPS